MPDAELLGPEPAVPGLRGQRQSRARDISVVLLVLGAVLIVAVFVTARVMRGSGSGRDSTHMEMRKLELAMSQYIRSYETLPFTLDHGSGSDLLIADAPSYATLLASLAGVGPRQTLRGQAFVALDADGRFLDPWEQDYVVALDLDYDRQITLPAVGTLPQSIAIWSAGPDGEWEPPVTDETLPKNRDNITSWEKTR